MKRIFLLVAASLMLAVPMFAQPGGGGGRPAGGAPMGGGARVSIDKDAYLKKIQKSDSEMAKKGSKAQYWLDRGKIMMDAETAVSKNLYDGITNMLVSVMFGKGTNDGEVTLGGSNYLKTTYAPYFVAYATADGTIRAWDVTYSVYDGALDKAVEAYTKAYEIDPKIVDKASAGINDAINAVLKEAECKYVIQDYASAGALFAKAYELSTLPVNKSGVNAQSAFNAGLSYYFANQFEDSYNAYLKAKENNFEQNGELYFYMYYSYKGLVGEDKAKLSTAKDFLMEGMQKYPEEAKIIESLTDVYIEMGEDPASIVPVVKAAIEKDPKNASLWNGLGRIYEQLKMNDEAIGAFQKVAEYLPDSYIPYYWIGMLYIRQGDAMNAEMNTKTYNGQADYDADSNKVLALYEKSIAPLEKAHELSPEELYFVEMLKNVTFRLRDMDGMMDKYNKYKELFDKMNVAPAQ